MWYDLAIMIIFRIIFKKWTNDLNLFQKFFILMTALLIVLFITSFYLIQTGIQRSYLSKNSEILEQHNRYLLPYVELLNRAFLADYARHFDIRITLIEMDGRVAYDSKSDIGSMENHKTRVEFLQAIKSGIGISVRYSHTSHQNLAYVATRYPSFVIRTAISLESINQHVRHSLIRLTAVYVTLSIVIFVIVLMIARRSTLPLKNLLDSIERFSNEQHMPHRAVHVKNEVVALAASFDALIYELRANFDAIKKLENMRKEFIANVSHELKTPLTSIMGFIETLETGAIHDPQYNERFLKIIKDNTQRLNVLINDILNLASIESQANEPELVVLNDVLETVITNLNLRDNPRIKLNITTIAIKMNANYDELYSAFLNYIDNALRYAPEGPITITLKRMNNEGVFHVQDQGPGIAKNHLLRLFERFYRPDKNRSRETGGTGLGLAIVKNVIEKYDGTVGVESKLGHGALFFFRVPLG